MYTKTSSLKNLRIDKHINKLAKIKREKTNYQFGDWKWIIPTGLMDIIRQQENIRKHFYVHQFSNINEMHKFLDTVVKTHSRKNR